jgi:thioredoxin reductase
MKMTDIAIIGAGAAGLSAALSAKDSNIHITMIEREASLGGILNQCIHNGFGLHHFKEELTGPEYAERLIQDLSDDGIELIKESTVIDIQKQDDFIITMSSEARGYEHIRAKAVIIASGCYERTRGALQIPGERPKGIMTAGSAQRYLNMDGYLVGQRVFILGSGDIGLIMARRMTLEGAQVLGVAEIMPYSNGLTRNIVQCLDDYDIPLYLSHTVTMIHGKDRLESIVISKVDDQFQPIQGTEKFFEVDTLLLSVGLIPDIDQFSILDVEKDSKTKSARVDQHLMSNISGLFFCGNALHVHDLVDWVSDEGAKAGRYAKDYVLGKYPKENEHIDVTVGKNIRYVVPQIIDMAALDEPMDMMFRVTKKMLKGRLIARQGNQIIVQKTANFLAPAEMEHLTIKPSDWVSKESIILEVEEIS